jgi:acetylornithine deacetylase
MDADARELLARLVAYPTVAGEPNGELLAFAAEHLAASGATVTLVDGTRPDGHNLHAALGPASEPGVVLAAHTDVVAVDGQTWTRDPFVLAEHDGRLYGRGTADMKGFIAAVLAAARLADVSGLRRPLHVALSSDEELGCRGVGPLLDHLQAVAPEPAYCVVGEPTRMRVAVRHKGKVALRAVVRGRACHSSMAPHGVNAVEYAARLIGAVAAIGDGLRAGPLDGAFSVPHATVSTGPVHGGVSLNIIPDRCTVEFELRPLPAQDPEPVLERVRAAVAALDRELRARDAACGVELETVARYPALAPLDGDPTPGRVAALAGAGAGGAVDFGTEAGLYRERLGVPVVVCGPGSMAQGHVADEYLEAEQLDAAVAFLSRMIGELARG